MGARRLSSWEGEGKPGRRRWVKRQSRAERKKRKIKRAERETREEALES